MYLQRMRYLLFYVDQENFNLHYKIVGSCACHQDVKVIQYVICFAHLTRNNSQDVLSLAPVDLDCCLTEYEREQLHELLLQKPLTNILSSVKEMNLASVNVSEIQEMIDKEKSNLNILKY